MIVRFAIVILLCSIPLIARPQADLSYYFPEGPDLDSAITSPADFFGFEMGEWHLGHERVDRYIHLLASESDRVAIETYAHSFEQRPLSVLLITHPDNHRQLQTIRGDRDRWCDLQHRNTPDPKNMPVLIYQGYTIHGNEASGTHAALLYAYYLAAGRDPFVERALREAVILVDPCMNPDGFDRFCSWVNVHRNISSPTVTGEDREFDEAWPGGRTNHFWFDLNRDWLPGQMPESQGRLRLFRIWQPNVLTDHHEMGTNTTFFFQPGVPARTNPLTPQRNQEITAEIGRYHAAALDAIGTPYYTKETFDDFYYGKGSTYPDINGCIGILFEQASARGHGQESENGLLTFPFAIRNQLATSISSLRAAVDKRPELLEYQRSFFEQALTEAKQREYHGYVIEAGGDPYRLGAFCDILDRHGIRYFTLTRDLDEEYRARESVYIPFRQKQYRAIQALFQTITEFRDSLFYDVSSWNMPMAFGLPYREISAREARKADLIESYRQPDFPVPGTRSYAYLIPWDRYASPALVHALLSDGLRLKVATKPFVTGRTEDSRSWPAGTVVLIAQNQEPEAGALLDTIVDLSQRYGVPVTAVHSGLSIEGVDIGSPSIDPLRRPEVLLACGKGVNPYEAGEIWHLLDQRVGIPVTKVEPAGISARLLSDFNTVILPSGRYNGISPRAVDALRNWVSAGGTLILQRGAIGWAQGAGLSQVKRRPPAKNDSGGRRHYSTIRAHTGARVSGGYIASARADLSNPLLFGYADSLMVVFKRGNDIFEPADNPYSTPMVYDEDPLVAGYLHPERKQQVAGSAGILLNRIGRGRIVNLADNHNFRAFWYGTNKILLNAIFFGHIIDRRAAVTVQPRKKPETEK